MKLIINHLSEIILVLVAIFLLIGVISAFPGPLQDFFTKVVTEWMPPVSSENPAPDSSLTLSAPFITLIGDELFISTVPNATSYIVRADNFTVATIASNQIDLSVLGLSTGEHTITVKAQADGYNTSSMSNSLMYNVLPDYSVLAAPGLYETGSNYKTLLMSWEELLDAEIIYVQDGVVYTPYDYENDLNPSSEHLAGDLMLPNDGSVTSLGSYDAATDSYRFAFPSCTLLTEVYIPDSVTTIHYSSFYNCAAMKKITIPSSVTTIYESAVFSCYELTTVVYQGNLEQWLEIEFRDIGSNPCFNGAALYIDGDLVDDVIIPNTTNSLAFSFVGCTSLTSVTFAEGCKLTTIGQSAFEYCPNLTKIIIPDSVTTIDRLALSSNDGLISVGPIGSGASVELPDSVTTIGYQGIEFCSNLVTVTLPDSVTTIGGSAFMGCTSLTNVTFEEGSRLISIGDSAFSGTAVKSIVLPAGVTYLGKCAFLHCDELESITMGDNITTIYDSTFFECFKLKDVHLPANLTSLEMWAFYGCESLTTITLPDGLTSMGYGAFQACTRLTSITIPSSVKTIGVRAFMDCTSLVTINFAENSKLETIDEMAFFDCSSLASIEFPASLMTIGKNAFEGCTSLATMGYTGTMSQWENMSRGNSWKYGVPATEVVCSDGTLRF